MDPERWRKIEQLYHAALEREPGERFSFLAEACNGDQELRREVESLLAYDGSDENGINHPAWEGTTGLLIGTNARHLAPGTQLGPYRIESLIGAGGMGKVYRARDSRLNRDVALKFLAAPLGGCGAALERFRREAHVISALNHPNICTIHDVGEHGGWPFFVMELLEGHDLRRRLAGARLAPAEAVAIGAEICKGLEAAHARSIVHRDIKPANIYLTSNGGVKILDFGLAKPVSAQVESLTETGLTLGTLAYMAPEQARGENVDSRADLFSLGAVLYEMATGRQPFSGATPAINLDAVLNRTPRPAREVNPQISPELDRIISKALEKNRERRYQTASDLAADLQFARHEIATGTWRWKYFAAGLLLIALFTAGYALYRQAWTAPPGVSQWTQLTAEEAAVQPALSPDGHRLTFLKGSGTFFDKAEVCVKLLPDGMPVQLTHDGSMKLGPVFSPDGSLIAYTVVTNNFIWETWTVPVSGGKPRRWLSNAAGLKWIDRDHILFSEITERLHMLLSTSTPARTNSRVVYDPPHDRGMVHRNFVSPDRKWVVLAEMDNGGFLPCRVVPLDGSSSGRQVGPPGASCTDAAWSPDGRWLYLNSNAGGAFHIWRQRFPQGKPAQVMFGPTQEEGIWIDPTGKSLLTSAGITNDQVWVHDVRGERPVVSEGSVSIDIATHAPVHAFSPDGRKLFYLLNRPTSQKLAPELWETNLDTDSSQPVLPGVKVTGYDVAPDGQRLAYASPDATGKARLWIARLDHRSPPRQVTELQADNPCIAGDGTLFFRGVENRFNFVYRLDNQSKSQKVVPMPIISLRGCSADARWLLVAVTWPDPQVPRMWVAYPVSGGQPLPICAFCWPQWSRDGRILYFWFGLPGSGHAAHANTYALPIPAGSPVPKMPVGGITEVNVSGLPVLHVYEPGIHPGPDSSTYAFIRSTAERNIYRIPLR